jgi:signal transduction histidine kinase
MPMAVIRAGADRVLRRGTIFGAVLILTGAALSWRVSRSLTAPLNDLRSAAVAIASGDYGHRVRVHRPDELGDVANMFNTMANHIQATHDALAERFEEAQLLTEELEQSMAEADASREEAIAANNAKAEFLATMSHEIRTPINAVLGYADLLEIGAASPLNPDQRRYVERIKVSGSLLAGLVNDVLDFAKIESGRMRVDNVTTPVHDVVKAAFAVIEPYAVSREITLISACDGDLQFCGDRKRAEQVLLNLLSNGVKFSRSGGQITVTCRVAGKAPDEVEGDRNGSNGWVCISVKDEGVGIRPDHMAHIFEPFMQGETGYTRKHGGTGLGLSISRKLARMMNGDVTFESTLGVGSTFTLWLQREKSAAPVLWPLGIT